MVITEWLFLAMRWSRSRSMFARHMRQLSERQRQVLVLVADGQTNKEIAQALGVTLSAVKKHLSSMMSVYDVPNRAALVSFTLRAGLDGRSPDATAGAAPGKSGSVPVSDLRGGLPPHGRANGRFGRFGQQSRSPSPPPA
jgi:DNA-binding CsgD family transcriptional regulator